MNILLSTILSATLFLTFIILLFTGIRKRKKKPVYISIIFLLLTICAGAWTIYLFSRKAVKKLRTVNLENPFKPRTGTEIYEALFQPPVQNCVQVINHEDQLVPRLDCCIWLEFKTCPAELRRIITREAYIIDTSNNLPGYSPRPAWFKPEILGDKITLRNYNSNDPNHDQILIFSKDSTHVFYCDMAD